MKLVLACLTSHAWEHVGRAVDNGIANGTLLYTLKVLIDVSLPHQNSVHDGSILGACKSADGERVV